MAFDLVHKFKSTDTGAPTLSGTAGDMVTVLDALLVNGYNSKTGGTLSRSGSTATWSLTAHGFTDKAIVSISGWDQSEYNGLFEITRIDANSFSFTVSGTPTTPATSAGSSQAVKVAPAGGGWTKYYSGTNKAAYKQPAASNGFYLRVDHNTSAQNAIFRGYETMSDVDTGTGLFPTTTLIALASGPYLFVSSAASGTTRAWKCFSDGRAFIFIVNHDGSTGFPAMMFGDFRSFVSGDAYNTMLLASSVATSLAMNTDGYGGMHSVCGIRTNSRLGSTAIARAYTQTGGAIQTAMLTGPQSGNVSGSSMASLGAIAASGAFGPVTYPAPAAGGLLFDQVLLTEDNVVTSGPRGVLRGIFAPCHTRPGSAGDTFSGTGAYAGRKFELVGFGANGRAIIQTSDWSVDG